MDTPLWDEDADFGDPEEMNTQGISQARWDRAQSDCDVRDIVDILHDRRGNPCGCPFHGFDAKPSFYFYPQNNSCFCFGCPDGDGGWDPVKLVSRSLDISRTRALLWLEREFKLPPILNDTSDADIVIVSEDPDPSDEPEEVPLQATVADLREPFLQHAEWVVSQQDPEDVLTVAKGLLEAYFTADKHEDPIPLARVLGAEEVLKAIHKKRPAC